MPPSGRFSEGSMNASFVAYSRLSRFSPSLFLIMAAQNYGVVCGFFLKNGNAIICCIFFCAKLYKYENKFSSFTFINISELGNTICIKQTMTQQVILKHITNDLEMSVKLVLRILIYIKWINTVISNSEPFANSYQDAPDAFVLTFYAIFSEIQCLVLHVEA